MAIKKTTTNKKSTKQKGFGTKVKMLLFVWLSQTFEQKSYIYYKGWEARYLDLCKKSKTSHCFDFLSFENSGYIEWIFF